MHPSDEFLPTRRSLLARLKNADDQESWREFFDTYGRLIYGVARQSGLTESEAEDAVQETVISVARTMPGFQYDPAVCSFKSWLRHLMQKRIVDQFRKRRGAAGSGHRSRTGTSSTPQLERIPDPKSIAPDAVWEAEWQKNIFDAAVDRVRKETDPGQFQIFDLYVLRNWTVKQVTEALGVNAGQVYLTKHRLMRLVKREAKRLEKEGL